MSELPQGWSLATIGDVTCNVQQRQQQHDEEFYYIDISSIDRETKKISNPQLLTGDKAPSRARQVVKAGDVLVSMTRPNLNAVALVTQELDDQIASTGFDVLRPVEIESRWLFNLVRSGDFVAAMSELVQGALYPAVRPRDIRGYEISVAPLNEQKRIADKLDSLLSRIDACRERLDRVPLILKRFRQAVLAAATSGSLTEKRREKGKFQSASTKLLSKVVTLKTGPFGSALHKEDYVDDGIPIINPMHINDGRIMPTSSVSISADKADELKDFRLITGDVIIARRGVMGRCAVVTEVENNWLCGTGSMILRPTMDILPQYLQICLSSPEVVAALEHQSVGSTMVNLNQGILLGLEIIVPSIPEQHEIVRRVETLFAFADRLEARYIAGREQVEQLTPSLLDKAFRGELVPQDPNDEPAEKLLEGIRTAKNNEIIRPTRIAPGRKSTIMKITAETVKKTILQMPNDHFSFDELRNALPGDYESLKDVLFSLLGEPMPNMQQFFDPEVQSIRFKRVKL